MAHRASILSALLCFLSVLISGCGTSYMVSVDSLRDNAQPDTGAYFLAPGNEDTREDDLFFRQLAGQLEPAFLMQGKRVVSDRAKAENVVRVSYWEEEPRVNIETGTRTTSQPVVVHEGRKRRVEYVYVEEPTITTSTIYTAGMLLEAYALKQGKEGAPLWRTSVSCSGSENDFRGLLNRMMPVLSRVLGTQTSGLRRFEVFVEDNGKITVTEQD